MTKTAWSASSLRQSAGQSYSRCCGSARRTSAPLRVEVAEGRGGGASRGKAQAAALHADLQAVCRLTAGVDDATVHVAGEVTVTALLRRTAAAEARVVPGAGATGRTVQHNVAQSQELTKEARQNTVNTAVCILSFCGNLRAGALGAALAPFAALGGNGRVGLQLLGVLRPSGRG